MKAYKPLQEAFRKLDQSTVTWSKSARFPKTMETANAILYRDVTVDASTLAYMAHCLDIPNTDIITILDQYAKEVPKKAAEVAVLKKLIAPVDFSSSEVEMINQLRKLDDSKRKLVIEMVKGLSHG